MCSQCMDLSYEPSNALRMLMCSSVGLVDIDGGGGKQERSGSGGGGGGRGKRGAVLIGVGDGGVGTLRIERVAERWWDNTRVSSSSCVVRGVVSGSRVSFLLGIQVRSFRW